MTYHNCLTCYVADAESALHGIVGKMLTVQSFYVDWSLYVIAGVDVSEWFPFLCLTEVRLCNVTMVV